MMDLAIDSVVPNPNQPRRKFDQEKLQELADSIKTKGLIEPIVVRTVNGNTYEIIAGERRWQACKLNGNDTIKAYVREADDREAMELALIENLHRDDLNAIEEARGYKVLIDEYHLKQAEVAEQVSKSRVAITNKLRLLELPDEIQVYVFEGKLSEGHARALLGLDDEQTMLALGTMAIEKKLTVRDVENYVRLHNAGEMPQVKREPSPRSYKIVARNLRKKLGSEVRVSSSRGKNKIVINFTDESDLQRIYRLIMSEE